jgi:hypothetical protein
MSGSCWAIVNAHESSTDQGRLPFHRAGATLMTAKVSQGLIFAQARWRTIRMISSIHVRVCIRSHGWLARTEAF